jgi:plasmid replication initiation protein
MALKYTIENLSGSLPKSFNLTEWLISNKITQRTYRRDKAIQRGSKTSIDGDRLRAYATLFGCSMEQLHATPITSHRNHKRLKLNNLKSQLA